MTLKLEFVLLDGSYALARLPRGRTNIDWKQGEFAVAIASPEGTTLVCEAGAVPQGAESQSGFRCLRVGGSFALDSVGVVAATVQPLASAGIGLFAYSTWETDYILIQQTDLQLALSSLTQAGHKVRESLVLSPDD